MIVPERQWERRRTERERESEDGEERGRRTEKKDAVEDREKM